MIRRLPILPTLIVLLAVGVMVRLGFWQLDRRHEKEAMLARFAAARSISAEVPWDGDQAIGQSLLFRRGRVDCVQTAPRAPMAGHNAKGETGWAQQAGCVSSRGHSFDVVLGWSRQPGAGAAADWRGGALSGWIAPGAGEAVRFIADPPLAGLEPNAAPDPASVPNNHLAYAVQWFLFAGVALAIYGLAVRKRLAAGESPG